MWKALVSFLVTVVLAFALQDRITRYAGPVRLMIAVVTATCFIPATYYFLNGILDGNPAVEVSSHVISKQISQGKYGGPDLVVNLRWNRETIEEVFRVGRETYSTVKPGDSVWVVVHPGAFSTAWYGKGLLSTGHDAIELGSNRQ